MGWLACAAYSPGYAREHCLSSSAVPILEMRGARGFPCTQPEIARRRTHVRDSNTYRRRGHDDRQRRSPMKLPVQITARHMSLSEAAEAAIREKAAKLDTFYDRIMSCRVLVEAPHRSQQNGMLYNVRIDLTIPGAELVVKREPHEDLYVTIRDAFNAARRQLQSHVRKQRGEVKTHEEAPLGKVTRIYPDQGYGFIETVDGREVYFLENCVSHGTFKDIHVGLLVRFAETSGEQGPQATVVSPV